ncbi:MAG: hypothetical protein IPP91_00065 [Betaproteobacteria bacterium]|nr:hypothetical protein [Betaproteobacteria bacterium]
MDDNLGFWIFAAVLFILGVVLPIRSMFAGRRAILDAQKQRDKNEALFLSMFPELQPYYHPAKLVEYVAARAARKATKGAWRWATPPGFEAAAQADIAPDPKGERVRLLDVAGKPISEFVYGTSPEGGVLRVGKGKLTVDVRKPKQPRVRYWHPEREFKWSLAGWEFKTPVADEPFESSSSRSSFSSEGSDSSRSIATAAAFAGLGGTFDGGGASAGWDGAEASASSASAGGTGDGAATDSSSDSGDSSNSSDSGGTSY